MGNTGKQSCQWSVEAGSGSIHNWTFHPHSQHCQLQLQGSSFIQSVQFFLFCGGRIKSLILKLLNLQPGSETVHIIWKDLQHQPLLQCSLSFLPPWNRQDYHIIHRFVVKIKKNKKKTQANRPKNKIDLILFITKLSGRLTFFYSNFSKLLHQLCPHFISASLAKLLCQCYIMKTLSAKIYFQTGIVKLLHF